MQAMILAAGLGTRLQPYSLVRPKPLFPVLNQPLLLATIDRLKQAGFTSIVINCHHLGLQVVSAVKGITGVIVQEEPAILGTGGSLSRAVRGLENKPLLVSNGDIYHTIDFAGLYAHHVEKENDVTLVLHNHPRFNKLEVSGDQVISFSPSAETSGLMAFTGLQVVNPDVLYPLPADEYSCIIAHYRSLLAQGRKINCRIDSRINWTDMGTVSDYLSLHGGLLHGTIPRWPELGCHDGSPLFIHEDADCGKRSVFKDWVSIGKAMIGEDVLLQRCVVWDGAEVESGSRMSDRIIVSP